MAKKVVQWIGAVVFALLGLIFLAGSSSTMGDPTMQGSSRGVSVFFFAMAAIFALCAIAPRQRARQKKQMAEIERMNERLQEVAKIDTLEEISSPVSIVLRPGEACYYQAQASSVIVKEQVVGYTGSSAGVSVRVAKGVTLRSGGSRGRPIRQDVARDYPGFFTLTDQRVIMTGEKGFEHPLVKLTSIEPWGLYDGLVLQFGRSTHIVTMAEPYMVPKIVELIGKQKTISEQ